MSDRRSVVKSLGLGGAILAASQNRSLAQTEITPQIDRVANELHEAIQGFQLDDSHCHASPQEHAEITPREYLLATSLAAMPAASYFPAGVFGRWQTATTDEKKKLDGQYGIDKKLDEMAFNARESIFVKFLTKEMAQFLKCAPNFDTVIAARNERCRGGRYSGYMSDLFRDVSLTNAMVDTGFYEGRGDAAAFNKYAEAIQPCAMRAVARIETIQSPLMREDISFDVLETRFTAGVRQALDGNGNFGFKSWGMKWHQMERLGVIKPTYDAAAAKKSWEEYKQSRGTPLPDREREADRGRDLKLYLLTIALEECLKRDMPMEIHAGDGEAPGVILRRQHPYNLEEVVRFDRDGVMRMPRSFPSTEVIH